MASRAEALSVPSAERYGHNIDIAYNGGAGWDFDDGNATPSVNALLNANGLIVEWNGCNQAYPGTGAISCYSQTTGGYGDGIGRRRVLYRRQCDEVNLSLQHARRVRLSTQ